MLPCGASDPTLPSLLAPRLHSAVSSGVSIVARRFYCGARRSRSCLTTRRVATTGRSGLSEMQATLGFVLCCRESVTDVDFHVGLRPLAAALCRSCSSARRIVDGCVYVAEYTCVYTCILGWMYAREKEREQKIGRGSAIEWGSSIDRERERERKWKIQSERGKEDERRRERKRENDDGEVRRSDQNVNVLLGGRPGPHCAADGRRRDASPPEHASSSLYGNRGRKDGRWRGGAGAPHACVPVYHDPSWQERTNPVLSTRIPTHSTRAHTRAHVHTDTYHRPRPLTPGPSRRAASPIHPRRARANRPPTHTRFSPYRSPPPSHARHYGKYEFGSDTSRRALMNL